MHLIKKNDFSIKHTIMTNQVQLKNVMNKLYNRLIFIFGVFVLLSCTNERNLGEITISNPHDFQFYKSSVEINIEDLSFDPEQHNFILTQKGSDVSIPYQLDDLDENGTWDHLFFQIDLEANESKTITILKTNEKPVFEKLTDGVLKIREVADPESMQVGDDFEEVDYYQIPSDLKQDNGLVFLEGPAWESNLVGYRFYIDDRTRFDIFGKTTNDLVLNNVSGDYHQVGDWGADILSVGPSLGMGSPAVILNGEIRTIDVVNEKSISIISDGPLRTIIRTHYMQWKLSDKSVDLTMNLEIHAHHRYTKLSIESISEEILTELSTGIVKHATPPGFQEDQKDNSLIITSWGNHSYFNDILGKALFVQNKFNPVTESNNDDTYLINMSNSEGYFEYYFLAAWEKEPQNSRINNEEEFQFLLQNETNQLFNNLEIDVSTN